MIKTIGLVSLLLSSQLVLAQNKLDRQGHRGTRGLMPENTIQAMKKAMDIGVETLELDVIISKDRQVVVSHDPYMSADITTKPDGTPVTADEQKSINLYQLTYDQIKKYDVGSKKHPQFPEQKNFRAYKPLLTELIDSVEAYAKAKKLPQPRYNIEIKMSPATDNVYNPEPAEFVKLVMPICQQKLGTRYNIQSFDARPLQLIHKEYPTVAIAYLTANTKSVDENLATLGFTPKTYSPYYKGITAETVKACHDKGMQIIPWTVNTKPEIEGLVKLGVDGIITDYPNLF
ncbi:glycerophosphodiester phosphodiesterase family protein [Spirosoma sp. KUDC1026]|uniref:glycerophosphodiester phosphodiesterase family protein n=1 Tax=Spirosoma sp. KUDC1026 TaxID=2745947 RepID=UPI00159BA2A4|nr:glycerophosphodiester phosphodiesterase family protein [Spirosoma sp. KUDC1026]QKZ12784.1 glycerophosphodiester phosphodiesterase [Spirosoma sp. KUDC1026]